MATPHARNRNVNKFVPKQIHVFNQKVNREKKNIKMATTVTLIKSDNYQL